MERLQKALNKARAERQQSTGDPAPAAAAQQTSASEGDQSWDTIPRLEKMLDPAVMQRNRLVAVESQASATPFDILRTKIFLLMNQNGWKRMAITSPEADCGKSTVACNLLASFSRQSAYRIVLLDLDLRRPSIAKMMGYEPKYDMVDVLTGDVSLSEQLYRFGQNAAISGSKKGVPDSGNLLLSSCTSETLDALDAQYNPDMTIIDLPPMLGTDDTRAVLKYVDCALIITRAEQTKLSQLDTCEREVAEHTNVLGVVLNQCRHLTEEVAYYGEESAG